VASKLNHTPPRSFRPPPALWKAAQERAASEGRTITDVLVELLVEYVSKPGKS